MIDLGVTQEPRARDQLVTDLSPIQDTQALLHARALALPHASRGPCARQPLTRRKRDRPYVRSKGGFR